ncbi:hypothetical protein FSP39_005647 [Pinctada imbricata]|uniref:Major facilitator superfamily (MFS) profile domain-containing protein n=1 Tax=Pinctada imbricata TaxID=66713 RepID=A0AA89C6N9_PINIB|nr:hypothetical protein FSP39_005647 [Pinctada imbricata]
MSDEKEIDETTPLINTSQKQHLQSSKNEDSGSTSSQDKEKEEFSFSGTSRRNKILLISMAMINFCASCGFSLLAPFFPAEAAKKGASSFVTGLIFGDFEFFIFLTSPIFGNYLTRIGSRFMFISGVMVCGSCSILFGLLDRSPDGDIYIIMCFLCRSMEALGASAYVTALFAIIASSFPNHVTTVLGLLETFSGIGMVAGPAIGGALYEAGGFGFPFFVVGSFVICIGVVCILAMPKIDDAHKPFSKSILYLLRNPYIIFVALVISAGSFAIGFIDPTLAKHVSPIPQLNNKAWAIGLMFMISTGTYTLTAPLWGYLCDKKVW